ncbi:unannotated protein [freshwater metagenome]|uniref:Unannotated protein n=1 Tax=freshwater metagenome TaxID=449393 RepID=A0A6J7FAJ4_9ZZZZ
MVGGDACLELGEELAEPEHGQVAGVDTDQAAVDDGPDAFAILGGCQMKSRREAGFCGFVALVATEDEIDRWQHAFVLETLDDLDA